jgi:phage shock protein C
MTNATNDPNDPTRPSEATSPEVPDADLAPPPPLPPPTPPVAPVAPAPHAHRPRRLYRSRTDEWFGGVAGGLADHFNTDPTLIRVLFVVAALLSSGFAILGYIAAWIIIPQEPVGETPAETEAGAAQRKRGATAAVVWGIILITAGSLLLLAQLDLDIPVPSFRVVLSAALIAVGVMILVEARRGFSGGLITLAVVLTLILGASSITRMDFNVDGAFGDQQHVVTDVGELRNEYSHAFGSVTVDLRNLELPPGTTHIEVSVAFGEATIRLPEGVPYRVEGSAAFGNIEGPGFNTSGIAASRTHTSPGYAGADTRLDIELSAAFGNGRVR